MPRDRRTRRIVLRARERSADRLAPAMLAGIFWIGVSRPVSAGAHVMASADLGHATGRYPIAFRGHRRRPPRGRVRCGAGSCHGAGRVAARRKPGRAPPRRPRQLGGFARDELAGLQAKPVFRPLVDNQPLSDALDVIFGAGAGSVRGLVPRSCSPSPHRALGPAR